MRHLILAVLTLVTIQTSAQFIGTRTNTADSTQERFVTNSPGNLPANSRLIQKTRDSVYDRFLSKRIQFDRLASTFNDGVPGSAIFADASGNLQRSTLANLGTALGSLVIPDSSLFATRNYVTTRGYLTTESDPVWSAASTNYWTKTQADGRYLQSESDPVWSAAASLYYTKLQADARYLQSEVDPVWTAAIASYYTKTNLQTSGQAAVHWNNLTNTPTFATVATTGAYNDLTGRPTLAPVATSGAYADLTGRPSLAAVATSGAYADLSGRPTLATVATTGAYGDLSGRPTLATVATTGVYSDLTGRPSLATVATSGAYADLTGKPSLATVATSGSYTDLINKPTIPAAQIQSDWTQTSSGSLDFIKNKPSRVPTQVTRTLNSSFQPDVNHDVHVVYTVRITCVLSLLAGQTGTVFLEYSTDNVNWFEYCRGENSNSGILGLTNANAIPLVAVVPKSYFLRLRTTGTATIAYVSGTETQQ